MSITVGKFPPTEADIDARNLESAIYNGTGLVLTLATDANEAAMIVTPAL